jgi:hypothetical protein
MPPEDDRFGSPSRRRRLLKLRASLSKRARRPLSLALLLLLVAVVACFATLHHRVQTNRKFCLGVCHRATADARLAAVGPHRDLPCESCHRLGFISSVRQYVAAKVRGPAAFVPHAPIDPVLCGNCHLGVGRSGLDVSQTVGHKAHTERGVQIRCSVCHDSKTHELSPKPAACTQGCHEDMRVFEPKMAGLPCLSCHNFMLKASPLGHRTTSECRPCHGGEASPERNASWVTSLPAPVVGQQHIHGYIGNCGGCHDVHKKALEERRSGRNCGRCHANVPSGPEAIANPSHAVCGNCHQAHSLRANLRNACVGCHGEAEPKRLDATVADKHTRCGQCHVPHEFTASRGACRACHEAEALPATNAAPVTHGDCGTCHAPHRAIAKQDSCRECHTDQKAAGHGRCTTCHDPHKDRSATKACTKCHERAAEGLVSGGGRHVSGCSTCHDAHSPGRVAGRCKNCHEKEAAMVATARALHGDCASCHRPHAFVARSSDTCNGCHKIDAAGAHRGDCKDCHASHGSPAVSEVSCKKCHPNVPAAASGKHADCRSCHEGHKPAGQSRVSCARCHPSQDKAAQAWPAKDHQNCLGCHDEHNLSTVRPCETCHGAQAKTAKGSKHACVSCHAPHGKNGAARTGCADCHGAEARAAAGRGPTHANCAACHKPHAIGTPTCQRCHAGI